MKKILMTLVLVFSLVILCSCSKVNQKYEAEGVNPEFTANIMVSCVRACMKAYVDEDYGTYTFIERPLVDYLPGVTIDEKLEGY